MTTYSWIGLSGSYNSTADWSPTPSNSYGIPENDDSITFGGTNTYTVAINPADTDAGVSLNQFSLTDPNAAIVFSGAGVPLGIKQISMSAGMLDVQFDTGIGGEIGLTGPETFSGGVINFSSAGSLVFFDVTSGASANAPAVVTAPSVVTLGAGLTVNELQGNNGIGYGSGGDSAGDADDKLTNQGTILAYPVDSHTH